MIINSNVYLYISEAERNPDTILHILTDAIRDYISRCPEYKDKKSKLNAYYTVFSELERTSRSMIENKDNIIDTPHR